MSGLIEPSCLHALSRAIQLACGVCRRLIRSLAALTRDDVSAVPLRPVMLRSRPLVLAVALLCFSQQLGHRRDVRAESSSGKPRLHLLKQPAVAVGIAERRE